MFAKVFFYILMYGRLRFCLRRELNDVSVVEDGGKDCVVVVHLVHAVHAKLVQEGKLKGKMKAFYIREKDPFKVRTKLILFCLQMREGFIFVHFLHGNS